MKKLLSSIFTLSLLLGSTAVPTFASQAKNLKSAKSITTNKRYSVTLKTGEKKYFRFKLSSPAKLNISLKGPIDSRLSYLNAKGKSASCYIEENRYFKKGTYYFRIYSFNDDKAHYTLTIKKTNYSASKMKRFAPTNISNLQYNNGTLTADFKKDKDVTDYEVIGSTDASFNKKIKGYYDNNKITIDEVSKGQTYYVKVRPYRQGVKEKYYGAYSNTLTIVA